MIDTSRLQALAAQYGVPLAPNQLRQLAAYAQTLVEWNEKINLTAITQPQEIEIKHFLDSLLLAAQPEVAGNLVDVGSGAGFPGMVVKLYKPQVSVTLMEPTGKRVTFLEQTAKNLGLALEIVKERAEEAARKRWRESFGVATARGVASLPVLCEYCLPLVRVGGLFIAMKAASTQEEIMASQNAIQKLGGKYLETRTFQLPGNTTRSLVFVQKVAPTPAVYPRNGGKIAKAPL
ncbi:MAG: 16S rRNA (guanine(527)-N(7))-methyltransferase RsmG [Oscillospiraceae bacterium]